MRHEQGLGDGRSAVLRTKPLFGVLALGAAAAIALGSYALGSEVREGRAAIEGSAFVADHRCRDILVPNEPLPHECYGPAVRESNGWRFAPNGGAPLYNLPGHPYHYRMKVERARTSVEHFSLYH